MHLVPANDHRRELLDEARVSLGRDVIIRSMIFHVVIDKDEDGWFIVECPSLPGCVSQGKSEQEALENIKEAITAWLWAEDQKALSSLPPPRASEAVLVTV